MIGNAVFLLDPSIFRRKIFTEEIGSRNVHRNRHDGQSRVQTEFHLFTDTSENIFVQLFDETVFFKERDEFTRAYDAAVFFLPAHQRLTPQNAASVGTVFRLNIMDKLPFGERTVHFLFYFRSLQKLRAHLPGVETNILLARIGNIALRHPRPVDQSADTADVPSVFAAANPYPKPQRSAVSRLFRIRKCPRRVSRSPLYPNKLSA